MNVQVKQQGLWAEPKSRPDVEASLMVRWEAATQQLRAVAANEGWSKSEAARRADVPLLC